MGTENQRAASGLSLLGRLWSQEADVQEGLKDLLAQNERFTKKPLMFELTTELFQYLE